tara:strand:- start:10144 stop:10788 length:645 start_codon:yes stop_codon:yes gene_type:complete
MQVSELKRLQRGFFIVFEGLDGSGKTTQSFLLKEFLVNEGYDTILLREPTNGYWGRKIKELLSNGRKDISPQEELNLFIEDRKDNINKNVLPAMRDNKVIIQDRYYFSTIAYQGALGVEPQHIRAMNEAFALKPDLVFYLDIKAELGLKRIEAGRKGKRDAFEKEHYLLKVKEIFDSFNDPFIKRINGSRPLDSIKKNIYEITIEKLSLLTTNT